MTDDETLSMGENIDQSKVNTVTETDDGDFLIVPEPPERNTILMKRRVALMVVKAVGESDSITLAEIINGETDDE